MADDTCAALPTFTGYSRATIDTPTTGSLRSRESLTGALREIVMDGRRRNTIMRLGQAIAAEQQARSAEQLAARQEVTTLARLIHDQAAPINGLWRVRHDLAQLKLDDIDERLHAHLDHLQVLTDQLRTYLKGQSPIRKLRLCRVEVFPIVKVALDAVADRAALCEVCVTMSVATPSTIVLGDSTAIRRIVDNLLTNALDATPKHGAIVVELWEDREYSGFLTITVRDTGCGLSARQRARLFAQRDTPTGGPGLGLGLTIVRDLVEGMNGMYDVTSTPGGGSTFWIRLPQDDGVRQSRQ